MLQIHAQKFLRILILAIVSAVYCFIPVYGAEIAEIQVAIITPDPVPAGENINAQLVVVNRGNQSWFANEASAEIEIYNIEQKYLQKTLTVKNDVEIKPGDSMFINVNYKIPTSYDGKYFYKVGISFKDQRIAYSDFAAFMVTPLASMPKMQQKVQFAGNTVISYRNSSSNNWDNSIGNIGLNVLGNVYNQSVAFNLYTNHTKANPLDLYNVIFNYYSSVANVSVGDVMPDLSLLSLRSYGARGLHVTSTIGIFDNAIVAVNAVPEDKDKNVLGRYFTAVQSKANLMSNMSLGLSYVYAFDQKNTVITPERTPVNNQVASMIYSWTPNPVSFNVEAAFSGYVDDVDNADVEQVIDPAIKAELGMDLNWFALTGSLQQTWPNFVSLASPLVIKDRQTAELNTRFNISSIASLAVAFTQYMDNWKNEPGRSQTTQQIVTPTLMLRLQNWPSLALSYSGNDITDRQTPKSVENANRTMSASLLYNIFGWNFVYSLQSVGFQDLTMKAVNTDTLINSLSINGSIGDTFTLSLGAVNSLTSRANNTRYNTNSESLTMKLKVIPEKLVLSVSGNYMTREDNSVMVPMNRNNVNVNSELTYFFTPSLYVVLGGGGTQDIDVLNSNNNKTDSVINTKVGLSF
ncbi:MAG: hypothetical protein WC955_01435 [Elusimicrobiota bacterium]